MAYYDIYKIIKDLIKTIFRSKWIKFYIFIVVVGIVLFNLDKVYGAYLNVDTTNYSQQTINYIDSCTEQIVQYCSENNIDIDSLPDYFVFTYGANDTHPNPITDWSIDNQEFFILISRNYYPDTPYNGCFNRSSNSLCYSFKFYTGSDEIIQVDRYTSSGLYDGLRIYYTNFENSICFENDISTFFDGNISNINPSFITTDLELRTFDFDYFQIDGGTVPYYTEVMEGIGGNAQLSLEYIYQGVTTFIDISNFITINSNNTFDINVPYNVLTNNVVVRNGNTFRYNFYYRPYARKRYKYNNW